SEGRSSESGVGAHVLPRSLRGHGRRAGTGRRVRRRPDQSSGRRPRRPGVESLGRALAHRLLPCELHAPAAHQHAVGSAERVSTRPVDSRRTAAPGAHMITDSAVRRPADQRAYRLSSIDVVRGLVIVIMAIDHVRDFTMVGTELDPMANPNIPAALFLTRWITHFCAPVFVLLAGTSAGLMTARKSPHALARFLVSRGTWLIFIEMFVISNLVTFSPRGVPEMRGSVLVAMQVIWAIGASMLALAALQYLGRR